MTRRIEIVDTTLRDGHQSQWATRMTTSMMLDVCGRLDEAGFCAIDLMGQPQFDASVRFLKEDPWQRLDLIRERVTRNPLRGWMRSKGFHFADVMAPDLMELWIERQIAHGIGSITCFDGLNDIENLIDPLSSAKKHGAEAVGALAFTLSPVHTDELYVNLARDLVTRARVDVILIKDSGALLTPERCRTLVPKIRKVIGAVPLEVHSHCNVGMALPSYVAAWEAGADRVHAALWPLGGGIAPPSTQSVLRNFGSLDALPDIDMEIVAEVSRHFEQIAEREGFAKSVPLDYDVAHYGHQVPGGMVSNFRASLEEVGLGDRMEDVLLECGRVRKDLGYPMLITPFAQLVGGQALLNVINDERYKVVLDATKRFALGYWGTPPAPVDPDVLDKIVANGARDIPLDVTPTGNDVADLRRRFPNMADDERLLRNMVPGSHVDEMLATRSEPQPYRFPCPTERLLEGIAARPGWSDLHIEFGETKIRAARSG
ncbi:MAG: carboxylase [Roseovarius sp.]